MNFGIMHRKYSAFSYVAYSVATDLAYSSAVEIITPSDPNQSGSQLCLRFSPTYSVEEINKKLIQQGVVVSYQTTWLHVEIQLHTYFYYSVVQERQIF